MISFLKISAICGFITVLTTLGIHLLFPDTPSDFEARVLLFQNKTYLLQRYWIIVHCLLALIAAYGLYILAKQKHEGLAGLGIIFFIVFAITEIARQMLVLFYLNGLRSKYMAAVDEASKLFLKLEIENFSLISLSLFGIFIFSFALANLFFGLSIWNETGTSKILSILLIVWSVGSFFAFANEFLHDTLIELMIKPFNSIYQPLMRVFIAWWIWKNAEYYPDTKTIERV